jgi:hypothetical protein
MSRAARVFMTLTLMLSCVLPTGCQSGPDLADVLPGSEPFQIDRWDVAILVTRSPGTTNRVQVDLAVQEVDELGRPAGPGVESRRDSFEVGKPFVWDRAAATSDRTLQVVAPVCRFVGRTIEVRLTVIASELGEIVKTRTLAYRIR